MNDGGITTSTTTTQAMHNINTTASLYSHTFSIGFTSEEGNKLGCLQVDTKLECLRVDTKLECVAFKQRQGFYRGQGETFQNACLRGMAKMFEVCQSSKEMKKEEK